MRKGPSNRSKYGQREFLPKVRQVFAGDQDG
jgi:hypothetical protein